MITLPAQIMTRLAPFAPLFSSRVWRHAQLLIVGALLAPGQRMVSTVLRALGLSHLATFSTYHRVLNRAVWSSLAVSRVLLGLLLAAFVPTGPVVVGIDETLERRRGAKIAAKGIYRDAARSSKSHFAKASGLRWVCMMLLVPIPWAQTCRTDRLLGHAVVVVERDQVAVVVAQGRHILGQIDVLSA
jgi:hypothetical protein